MLFVHIWTCLCLLGSWLKFAFTNPFSPLWEIQLRVHCAEVLGTPIVGDLKYGWQAHRKLKQLPCSNLEKKSNENHAKGKTIPFGLDLESGSIHEKHPCLHLHCKQMVLPNASLALQNVQFSSDYDLSEVESLELVAPLPSHMQRSWDILNSWATCFWFFCVCVCVCFYFDIFSTYYSLMYFLDFVPLWLFCLMHII